MTDLVAALAEELGLLLPPGARRSLDTFGRLLAERAVPLGLVAASDAERVRERHVADSLRAVAGVEPSDRTALDVGSGAGLPGVPVAIALPALQVRLVEPRRARIAFLELVIERLELGNATVVPRRIEQTKEVADLAFARAFAPAEEAWVTVRPHLRPGGRLVYFAGSGHLDLHVPTEVGSFRVMETSVLASAGPLVIMAR